ncbi:hypothetical protein RRG08_004883 [Elysia crispata]|uniref:Uncharacterized protein n=1 Tax=Elysia crispata TaxID=231223 RepID=A0AAE0ZIZ1_9GAST|nr:hypothetical protein RRG08_004883 [Elysia crispata]
MNSSDLSSGSTSSLNVPEVKLRNGRRSLATMNRRSDMFNIFRYSSVRLKVDLRKRRARSEYFPTPVSFWDLSAANGFLEGTKIVIIYSVNWKISDGQRFSEFLRWD